MVKHAVVKKHKRDKDGHLIGKTNSNPILDTSLYHVEFADGSSGTYAANTIAKYIFKQIDEEGHAHVLFDSIIAHKKGKDAVSGDTALSYKQLHGKEQMILSVS
jgi:hypothetical protein